MERTDVPHEGSFPLSISPTGKEKGPGKRAPVFYNPAMRPNRDITVVMVQALLDEGSLPGKGGIKILDGLCGTGIRGMRILNEVDWRGKSVEVHAVDNNPKAIEAGVAIAASIDTEIAFHRGSLNSHLYEHRYSFIDVDPYGSPLPFVQGALSSVIPGGTIAVTATDTAALCGSNRKVALRRYGAELIKTEYMKEISCRVLACSIARIAASMDLTIEPTLFFASDHYVRGFMKVQKGAGKADEMVRTIGPVRYKPPERPVAFPDSIVEGHVLGPMWLRPLEDPELLKRFEGILLEDFGVSRFLAKKERILKMIRIAIGEHDLPPFGFDTDYAASALSASPPPLDRLISGLKDLGYASARSRHGDKVIRTQANFSDLVPLIRGG